MSYGQADVFLIIFSVIDQDSFENALKKWYPELEQADLKRVPKLFVGNKVDLRTDNQNTQFIQYEAVMDGYVGDLLGEPVDIS